MDINIKYHTLNLFYVQQAQAACVRPQATQTSLTTEEKKHLLDEQLGSHLRPFKHKLQTAIAKYLTQIRSNCQQFKLPSGKIEKEAISNRNSALQTKTQPTPAEFLHDAKERYHNIIEASPSQLPQIHFVMGNEAADLDSVISSITYAYLLKQEHTSDQAALYIPLLNIRKEELAFRKDILYAFQIFNISSNDLLFLDDNIPFNSLFAEDKLRLNLVDHNLLRPSLEHLSDAVERVIDHHVDENKTYPLFNNKEDKLIAVVGSATTLVAEKILANKQISMTPELAALLLGPILVDTSNLKSQEKTTDRDRKVVESLWPIAASIIPQDYYERLITAKSDISNLTPIMLLSKDFKEYLDGNLLYGISSLPPSTNWWSGEEETLKPVLEKFSKDHGLAFLILLMNNPDPKETNRRIIVYSPSGKLSEAFKSHVNSNPALNEALNLNARSVDGKINYYTTKQLLARKQLQPLFKFSQNPELMLIFAKGMD